MPTPPASVAQADIDALTLAIANGERAVRFADGRHVEYHSPDELIRARDYLVELARAEAGQRRAPRRHLLIHNGRGHQ